MFQFVEFDVVSDPQDTNGINPIRNYYKPFFFV